MAIAVGHCHELRPPGVVRGRFCRLRSVAQLDRPLLDHDLDRRERSRFAGLSPRRSLSSPCFTTVPPAADRAKSAADDGKVPRVEIVAGGRAPGVHELIMEAAGAIATGTRLVPAQSGIGGALLLEDDRSGEHLAVIKLLDDAPSPSHGGGGYASKAVLREVAAFLLDHDGFARVEPTAMIKISRPSVPTTTASIQRFAAHEYDAGELGPSRFSVASVHHVGILDVRLLNIDRHAGNILVKKPLESESAGSSNGNTSTPLDLVPIDHGLCLPEQLDDPYFEWLHWPQSSLPFSGVELEYVASLDPFRDAAMLRAELPALTEAATRILTLCTIFLQRAAAAGLCLADIGDMMTREFSAMEEGLSALESLCKNAYDASASTSPRKHPYDDSDDDESTQFGMDDVPAAATAAGLAHFLLGGSGIAKSVSFSAAEQGASGRGGARKRISFEELTGEEWAAFLDRFEQLLPAALEAKKRAGLKLTCRLGTSV
ncbi:phosphatidylinositol 4-kinase gamma 8-like [Oryza brachyantha]|uniref:1-phosphatidylinositol 4-kinase n=1 Tax=Oryza brachyantha TaxID=4533 RepID=J3KYN9_ORYBR|nr:phosphatidylinositol 4-kinase gamma 8-like [Oryza brachyantha]